MQRVHTSWWEACIRKRKGNCITKVISPCYPWKRVEAIWAKESRFQGYSKVKWTSHHAQNHKGETSFPLKIKQKQSVTLGAELFKSFSAIWRRKMSGMNLFYWEAKEKWITTFLFRPFVRLLNLHYGRTTYQPIGPKMKWIPFNKHVFILLVSCVDSQSGVGKTNRSTQDPCLILAPC